MKRIREIFERFRALQPHPTTELIYQNPFELLIAVILSAQSTDVSVNKATKKLFSIANTPEKILQLGEEGLKQSIRTIGLYNAKSRYILHTCAILLEKFDGQVPSLRMDLESLPGVGRKTANVILNTAFGEATIAVDTHIFRVAQRLDLAQGKTPEAIEKGLMQVISAEFKKDAHHWLVLHGRYICKARTPVCQDCFLADLCPYFLDHFP